jgi:alkanesulfonate monooxygenase SsuD/methylene tetrahydromethanopterin reductase-like flavin-dependent oxidoreductase (luciferase family)
MEVEGRSAAVQGSRCRWPAVDADDDRRRPWRDAARDTPERNLVRARCDKDGRRERDGHAPMMAPLHLGLILPNYGEGLDAERLAAAAVAAEEAGFDSGWVTDHVIVPPGLAGIYGAIAEPLVTLGFLAGRTRRLELGVSALVVPQRNPLVVLKQLTTLDLLSGGRIVTAVAAGWMEGEFAVLGADFARRGRVLNEWLELAASAFEQMPGRIEEFDGWLAPALVRTGGPELWVAGVSRATLRRAAMTGVWHPVALPPGELRGMAAELRERRPDSRIILRIGVYVQDEPAAGRDERGRHAISGPPEWVAERLAEYVDAGCDGFVVNLDHEAPDLEERVGAFARDVVPRFAPR